MKARKNEDEVGRDAVYETTRMHAEKERRRWMEGCSLQRDERQSFQRKHRFAVSQMRFALSVCVCDK